MAKNVSRRGEGSEVPVVNLPNILTVLRLVLVPVFVVLVWRGQESLLAQWWGLLVFCVAAATDRLDGQIARACGLVTDFGRIVDPIADKALTLGAFVMLSLTLGLPWVFTVLVAVRELGITWLRADLLKRGIVVAASSSGKLKTVLQMLLIFLVLLPWRVCAPFLGLEAGASVLLSLSWAGVLVWLLAAAVLFVTYQSAWGYLQEGVRVWRSRGK